MADTQAGHDGLGFTLAGDGSYNDEPRDDDTPKYPPTHLSAGYTSGSPVGHAPPSATSLQSSLNTPAPERGLAGSEAPTDYPDYTIRHDVTEPPPMGVNRSTRSGEDPNRRGED